MQEFFKLSQKTGNATYDALAEATIKFLYDRNPGQVGAGRGGAGRRRAGRCHLDCSWRWSLTLTLVLALALPQAQGLLPLL